jgi:hypothetical protein
MVLLAALFAEAWDSPAINLPKLEAFDPQAFLVMLG